MTPAATYCAITGGTYAVTSNSGQPDEQGTCTLPGGVQCDATEYYDGKCDASTGKMPNTSGLALAPPAAEVCNGMAQALAEALLRANTQHANVEVTQSDQPVPMTDVATGAEGTGCRATATGTGEQFESPDAVMQQISAVLTGGGWVDERGETPSDGLTSKGWGFRSGDLVAYASVIWLPVELRELPEGPADPGMQSHACAATVYRHPRHRAGDRAGAAQGRGGRARGREPRDAELHQPGRHTQDRDAAGRRAVRRVLLRR